MTADIPRPLRRNLLLRAATAEDCTATERDQILRHMFPGLDRDKTLPRLRELWQACRVDHREQAEQIIAELIQQDREGRAK